MSVFNADGLSIAYEIEGEGKPVLLIHGFAGTAQDNWGRTGWIQTLARMRRQVITPDLRGHGASQKYYDPVDYGMEKIADDLIALLDHLNIEKTDVVGFSMGAGIAAWLASTHGDRFGSVVLAGVGGRTFESSEWNGSIVDALLADGNNLPEEGMAAGFRRYAESLGQDLKALAACASAPKSNDWKEKLGTISNEVLVIAGARDNLAGDPHALADLIPGARSEIIPGADHMFALANPMFKGAVMDFLSGWH